MGVPTARHLAAVGAALVSLTTACADAPTGPDASAPARTIAAAGAATPGTDPRHSIALESWFTTSGGPTDTTTVVLAVSPATPSTLTVGNHQLQLAANAICDPATSGYGPLLWDAPCTPATQTIRFTVKAWTTPTGRPSVKFSPDVRFVPGTTNRLWLLDPAAAAQKRGVLAWCPTGSPACVDESLTDPSLVTQYTADGYAYRRLKHFSGYEVLF